VGGQVMGSMLWFHETKGYGFIETEDGERLYVEREGFDGAAPVGRCAGLPVRLGIDEQDGRRVAVNVAVVTEDAPRRARRRGSGMRGGW
jgi:cold shock CspA family protein